MRAMRIVTHDEMHALHTIPDWEAAPYGLAFGDDLVRVCNSYVEALQALAESDQTGARAEDMLVHGGDLFDALGGPDGG